MILLLSSDDDLHLKAVSHELEKLNAGYIVFDSRDYPFENSISCSFDKLNDTFKLHIGKKKYSLNNIKSVWKRRTPNTVIPKGISTKAYDYINDESRVLLSSLEYFVPRDCFWLPKQSAVILGCKKPVQLMLAKKLGLHIPRTYLGNTTDEISNFVEGAPTIAIKGLQHSWAMVEMSFIRKCLFALQGKSTKKLQALYDYEPGKEVIGSFTQCVSGNYIKQNLQRAVLCPMTYQDYIPKAYELRITAVGNKLFPCAIYSQESDSTTIDWRADESKKIRHEICEIPQEVHTKLLQLLNEMGLNFGCIDMIVTPAGEYVFLEVNPNGQWLWVEEATGMPIASEIAKLLVNQTN